MPPPRLALILLSFLLINLKSTLLTTTSTSPNQPNKQDVDDKQQTSSNNNNGVEDILRDTMLLLDVLDQKLATANNKTANALMRDNLRSLDGASGEDSSGINDPDDEAALVKLADGFASGRRRATSSNGDGDLIAAASSNKDDRHRHTWASDSPSPDSDANVGGSSNLPPAKPHGSSNLRASLKKTSRHLHQSTASHNDNNDSSGSSSANSNQQQQLASDSTERHIKFTLDLMQSIFANQLYSPKTNLIESFLISPLSIQTVLMMMHLGARGQTRREISNCLHLNAVGPSDRPNLPLSGASNNLQLSAAPPTADTSAASAKLKRRHQVSSLAAASENVKPAAAAAKPQTTSSSATQQQQQQISRAATNNNNNNIVNNYNNNAHELFGTAVRNLLKDPIVIKALTSANQIFLQKNLPLSAQYEWAIRHYYAADVKSVDFQHQQQGSAAAAPSSAVAAIEKGKSHPASPASSSDHMSAANATSAANLTAPTHQDPPNNNNDVQHLINDWVERQTKGKISNFLTSPIPTSTLMMALNVLYFKGDWQFKFDPSDTESDAWFTQANGKMVKVPMMVNRLPLAFAHDPYMKTSVIELPYKAQRLGLFLLLPDEISGIFHTMQMLNSSSFANLISSMRKPNSSPAAALGDHQAGSSNGINVRIPKFSIDSSPRLSQILSQHLGLKTLFTPDSSDLSGMFAPLKRHGNGNGNNSTSHEQQAPTPLQVGLDELLHKAVLQVDEHGSVAAASSATIVERVGMFNSNYFEADHPFLLFLMDKQTGLVLFSGVFAGNNAAPTNVNGSAGSATNNPTTGSAGNNTTTTTNSNNGHSNNNNNNNSSNNGGSATT